MSSSSSDSVNPGHIHLVLFEESNSSFYLDIPTDIIPTLCLNPCKYLIFLSWCILGTSGELAHEQRNNVIEYDGDLNEGSIYYYIPNDPIDFAKIVDLDVIKQRSTLSSEATETCEQFHAKLLERDLCCVWTGNRPSRGSGMHIIPFQRGSEWLQLILDNRPQYGEDVTQFTNINDIRNGVFAYNMIHDEFDPRHVVILKTPNHILKTAEIPPRHDRVLPENVKYPLRNRYTLQWLETPDEFILPTIPNNVDAAFKRGTHAAKPSDLLMHYNYGAAAVKWWGRGMKLLQKLARPPRPSVRAPAPTGPSRSKHDRNTTIQKLDTARGASRVGAGNATGAAGTGEMLESDGQAQWDEDDVMMFFWGNSKAANERHRMKAEEDTLRMEQWRNSVPQDSV